MAQQTLHQRQKSYENLHDHAIMARLPVIVKLDGIGFRKVANRSKKPFDINLSGLLSRTMLSCMKVAEGAVFGYQYSDKIFIVLRNDQNTSTNPWFGNRLQRIGSFLASTATHGFASAIWQEDTPPDLDGAVLFTSLVFAVPNISESVNYLIYRQLRCMQDAVTETAHTCLNGNDLDLALESKTIDERKLLIEKEAGIRFEDLPLAFRRGVGAYARPVILNTALGQVTRREWIVDTELPSFSEDRDFIKTILTTGTDTLRPDRDLRRETYQ